MSDLVFDNGQFARQGRTLHGELSMADLPRVAGEVADGTVLEFAVAGGIDRLGRPVLDLSITGPVALKCQRCLKPLPYDIDVATRFTLFATEAAIDAAEADDEAIEGLLFESTFDLLNLIEDEILLSLPFAATHDGCHAEGETAAADVPQKPNPFAVLADIKGKLKRGEH